MANISIGELTSNLVSSATYLENVSVYTVGFGKASYALQSISQIIVWSTIWKVVLFILIAANFKNFPLIYHLRILNGIRFVLKSQRSAQPLTPDQLFQPLITSSKATMMETDIFGHKSNSTYFSDIDICRTHLVTTLFSKAIESIRGSTTMNGLSGKTRSLLTMPLGAVSCCFRREIKPYETYDMWTRILSWDEKWFYLVTHFVKKSDNVQPRQHTLYTRQRTTTASHDGSSKRLRAGVSTKATTLDSTNPKVAASALSKVVFKNNRHTIPPETMLKLAGLLPDEGEPKLSSLLEDTSTCSKDGENAADKSGCWTRESIEAERERGMTQAKLLAAQSDLDQAFNDDVALGRHYDGHGVEGVVATLAQLGGISSYQLL